MLSLLASAGALVPASSPLPPAPPVFHCGACSFNSGEAFIHTLPGESMPAGKWAFSLRADFMFGGALVRSNATASCCAPAPRAR